MAFKGLKKALGVLRKNKLKKIVEKGHLSGRSKNNRLSYAPRNYKNILFERKEVEILTDQSKIGAEINTFTLLSKPKTVSVINSHVEKDLRSKGLGTKLFEELVKKSRGKSIVGDVQSSRQAKIRTKFKTRKEILETYSTGTQKTNVPKSGFKKQKNKTTGKVKFIRKGGKIIPIRSKS